MKNRLKVLRAERAQKRGGDVEIVSLEKGMPFECARPVELLAVDEALDRLAEKDPRVHRVVELRFFGGLSVEETAEAMDVSREKTRRMMESQIQQVFERNRAEILEAPAESYLAMGSDIRFVSGEIEHTRIDDQLVEVNIEDLDAFTRDVLLLSPDKIVTQYHFSLPDAESFGPGLLTHLFLARATQAKRFMVANVNLRDGLIQEMAQGRRWSQSTITVAPSSTRMESTFAGVNRP